MYPVISVIALLALSAAFSASELAIMSAPLYKIKQLANSDSKLARLLLKLRQNSSRTLITILIWNNLVNVVLTIYASQLGNNIVKWFAISWAIWFFIISVTITTLILFFWEIVPKIFATKFSLRYALIASPFIDTLWKLIFPVVFFFESLTKLLNKTTHTEEKVSRSDVEMFVDEWKKQWIFSNIESMIIRNLFDFNERSVESILKHRTEIFALSNDTSLKEAIYQALSNPYSRIPVYENDKDTIVWMINTRDLLKYSNNSDNLGRKISTFKLRPVFKIPVTANVFDVFLQMKKSWHHFAIVVDEYWGTEWMITFEDILEDMVWDIKDESDLDEERNIIKIWVNELIVRWDVLLREILASFNIENFSIPEDLEDKIWEDDMISYIILTHLKTFAKKWDIVELWEIKVQVVELSQSWDKIEKVKVLFSPNWTTKK